MSIKSLSLFWKIQVGALAVAAAIFLIGDKSQPKIKLVTTSLLVDQPLVVTFDRTVDRASVEQGLTLTGDTTAVPGSFSWSSKSVAFTPSAPLAYDTTYTLRLENVKDSEGHIKKKPFIKTLVTSKPRFVYQTSNNELELYTLDTGTSVKLSDPAEKIIDYSISSDGQWVLAAFEAVGDSRLHGLYSARVTASGYTEKTMLYRGYDAAYSHIQLCSSSDIPVVWRTTANAQGELVDSKFVSFARTEKGFSLEGVHIILTADDIYDPDTFTCSRRTEQVLYHNTKGAVILGSLSDLTGTSLGSHAIVYGFSPLARNVLLADYSQESNNHIISLLNEHDVLEPITAGDVDSFDPVYDPSESVIAASEDTKDLVDGDYTVRSHLVAYISKDGGWNKVVLTASAQDTADGQPRWSRDGRYISFQRVPVGVEYIPVGEFDGAIIIARYLRTDPARLEELPARLTGGNVQWLP